MSYFEGKIGWVPSATQFHANLVFEAINGTTYSLVVGQGIINNGLGAAINMSQICGVNSGATPTVVVVAPPTEPTAYCGTVTGTTYPYSLISIDLTASVAPNGKLRGTFFGYQSLLGIYAVGSLTGAVTGSNFVATTVPVAGLLGGSALGTISGGIMTGTVVVGGAIPGTLSASTSNCSK